MRYSKHILIAALTIPVHGKVWPWPQLIRGGSSVSHVRLSHMHAQNKYHFFFFLINLLGKVNIDDFRRNQMGRMRELLCCWAAWVWKILASFRRS